MSVFISVSPDLYGDKTGLCSRVLAYLRRYLHTQGKDCANILDTVLPKRYTNLNILFYRASRLHAAQRRSDRK